MSQCSEVQSTVMLVSAVQCSAVQCSAVQYSAAQCSAVQCSAVQCSAVQYSGEGGSGGRPALRPAPQEGHCGRLLKGGEDRL